MVFVARDTCDTVNASPGVTVTLLAPNSCRVAWSGLSSYGLPEVSFGDYGFWESSSDGSGQVDIEPAAAYSHTGVTITDTGATAMSARSARSAAARIGSR